MRGIPLALGGSASLSVKREEGASCVERLAFFSPYIQPSLRRFGPVTGLFREKR